MSRKITVLVESTQRKVVLESNATTLGELKNELREMQVDFDSENVFKESRTKSILASDESVLPTNVPWKGSVTNELVFMITAPQKKIRSGMDRKEAYAKIKELGLQDKIQKGEGKNFTQCSTATLISYIEKAAKKAAPKAKKAEPTAPIAKEKPVRKAKAAEAVESNLDALSDLLDELTGKGIITKSVAQNIWGVANGQPAQPIEEEKSYSDLAKEFNF